MDAPRRFDRSIPALVCAVFWLVAHPTSGQTWQIDYDASLGSLPSAQGWTHDVADPLPDDGLNEGNYLVALGELAQGDTGGPNADVGNTQWYEVVPPSFDFQGDLIVVDLRLKILASTLTAPGQPTPSAGFGVFVRDESSESVTLFVGAAGLFLQGMAGASGSSLLVPFDSTLAYADYQLRVDRYGASVLVDGTVLATLALEDFDTSFSTRVVYLGDVSTTELSSSELQSFRLSRFVPPAGQVHNYETVTEYVPSEFTSDSTSVKSRTVSCPPGKKALGGGVETIGADGNVGLLDSRPSGGPPATSWFGSARELVDTSDPWRLRVDVICGEVSGYENLSFAEAHSTDAVQGSDFDCDDLGKVVIGGGAGVAGANLRQTLIESLPFYPIADFEFDWGVAAKDYGAGTSSSAWGMEIETICGDSIRIEPDEFETAQDMGSPKQAPINCTSGKVPIGGGASIRGWSGGEPALRASRPKDGSPGSPPVGWFAEAQVDTAPLWSLEAHVYCAPIADPTVSKTGLMSRWKGDDAGFDAWGLGHGTLENGVGFAPGILGQGQSFSFEGMSDQWVKIPSGLPGILGAASLHDLYPEASFSVEAWIQTSVQPSANAYIVTLWDNAGPNPMGSNASAWGLRLDDQGRPEGLLRHQSFNPGTLTVLGPGPISLADGQPHHLVLIRDSTARKLYFYVDGVLEEELTITITINEGPLVPADPLNPDPVAIGAFRLGDSTSVANLFTGEIDDVKYYDRALSKDEIQNTVGCGIPLVPRVLNLEASVFGNPAGGDPGLCVLLEAGVYRATLVTPALDPDARLTAWSPTPTSSWSTLYAVEPELDASSVGGFAAGSSTPQQAFDATLIKELDFTLTAKQRVHFSLVDNVVLDNRGGISVRLELLPEPSFRSILAAGATLLACLSRRRSRQRI